MKKFLFTLALITSFSISQAQTLNNTSWALYEGLQLVTHAHFVDTLFSVGTNLDELDDLATYTDLGNDFTVMDLDSSSSCEGFVGSYTYVISNDTLIFTTVEDSCELRNEAFADFVWVSLVTGIEDELKDETVKIYPNPALDVITIEIDDFTQPTNYSVIDLNGKIVLTGKLTAKLEKIDLRRLESGVYILDIDEYKMERWQFIKE